MEASPRELSEQCRSTGKVYSDPDFRPGPKALYRPKNEVPGAKPTRSGITGWKRPRDVIRSGTVQLYVEGASGGDVIQGALGDCWFLGALSVVATRPDLLRRLFPYHDAENGIYQCSFFKDGRWQEVIVDDMLPCIGNKLAYATCRDANEVWVPIIEKAYAKLHGNYQILEGGSVAQGLVDLTGGASEKISFSDEKVQRAIKSGVLWKRLKRYDASGFLMGCAFSAKDGPAEADTGMGILQNHAYGIMDVVEAGPDKTRLLRIRNPWGATEWKGRWSDGSRQWTKRIKQELDYEFGDDGTFWMCFEDFVKHFNKVYVCRLYEDDVGAKWKKFLVRDAFDQETAGGCMDHASWRANPQFAFKLSRPRSRFFAVVAQDDCRMRGATTTDVAIGFYVFRVTGDASHKLVSETAGEIVGRTGFSFTREVSLELNLEDNGTYIIMPCTYDHSQQLNFTLTVYGEHDFSLRELGDAPSGAVEGEWKYGNAGGCPNHPSWNRNDQYLLYPLEPSEFTVVLSQPKVRKPRELNQFGFQVADVERGESGIPALSNDNMIAQSDYTNAESVTAEVMVDGDAPVSIIPSTFMPTKLGKFKLRVYGESPFLLGKAPRPDEGGGQWEGLQLMRIARETGVLEDGPTLKWIHGEPAEDPIDVPTPQPVAPPRAGRVGNRQNIPPVRVEQVHQQVQAPGSSSRAALSRDASTRASSRAASQRSSVAPSARSQASSRARGGDSSRGEKVIRHGRRASQASSVSSRDSRAAEEIRRLEQLALTSERPRPTQVIQKGPKEAVGVISYGLWSRINPGYSRHKINSTAKEDFAYDQAEARAVRITSHNRVKNDHTEFVEARARQNNLIKQGGR